MVARGHLRSYRKGDRRPIGGDPEDDPTFKRLGWNQPMNRDEKGRISPAQSKVAQAMSGRKPLLPMNEHQRSMLGKTMGGMAREQEEKHHYGKGLKRLEHMKKTSPNKIAKARIALRGQKSDYRKAYTKGLTETTKRFKAKGMM